MPKFLRFAFIFLFCASAAQAQDEIEQLSPFASGAGRTYALNSRGLDAVGVNPSLLALGTPKPFEISLIPVSTFGLRKGPNLSDINSIASGFQDTGLSSQTLAQNGISKGDSTRESIASLLANNGISSTIDARIFGMSYYNPNIGGFALTWTMHSVLQASVPSALLSYIGVGAASRLAEGYALSPQDVDVQAMWYSEYTLSYARTVYGEPSSGNFQVLGGLGVKYLAGIAMLQMNPGEFDINDDPNLSLTEHYIVGVNYQIRSAYPSEINFTNLPTTISAKLIANATAGSGVGADIGFTLGEFNAAQYSPWQAAISISDIGSIRWTSNAEIRSADTVLNPNTAQSNKDTINNQLKALGGTLNSVGSFSTPLPTTLHIAGALDLSEIGVNIPSFTLEAVTEYALGLTNTAGAPVNGRFGFALTLEHPSDAFSFHTALGLTTQNGITDLTFAVGFGIANSVLFDVGTDGLTELFSATNPADVALGLKVLF